MPMSADTKILIVDDAPDGRMLLSGLLEDDYSILEAESGEECLEIVKKDSPDLILLDVNMPGMSGYEVCVELRKQPENIHLPIIFVSGLDTVEERLQGYEAGCNEYLIKPADPDELFRKVEECLTQKRELDDASNNAQSATQVALEAMTVSSELGLLITFFKSLEGKHSALEVGNAFINVCEQLGLKLAIRIDTGKVIYVGCEEDSLEGGLLSKFTKSSEKIVSAGIRTIICESNIVVLVKDMPLNDENKYGRFKDHLAVLIDFAQKHLSNLLSSEVQEKERQKFLVQIIGIAEEQIRTTSDKVLEHATQSQRIMQGMLNELENMLFGLGLDEDQEKKLMALADNTSTTLEGNMTDAAELSSNLGGILEKLYEYQSKG